MGKPRLNEREQRVLDWLQRREAAALQTPRTALTHATVTAPDVARFLDDWIGGREGRRLNLVRADAMLGYLATFDLLECLGPATKPRWGLPGLKDRIAAIPITDSAVTDKAARKARKPKETTSARKQPADRQHGAVEQPATVPAPSQTALFDDQPAPVSFVRRHRASYTGPVWRGKPRTGEIVTHLLTSADGDPRCDSSLDGDWIWQQKVRQHHVTQRECCPRCWQRWIRSQLDPDSTSWGTPPTGSSDPSPRQDAA